MRKRERETERETKKKRDRGCPGRLSWDGSLGRAVLQNTTSYYDCSSSNSNTSTSQALPGRLSRAGFRRQALADRLSWLFRSAGLFRKCLGSDCITRGLPRGLFCNPCGLGAPEDLLWLPVRASGRQALAGRLSQTGAPCSSRERALADVFSGNALPSECPCRKLDRGQICANRGLGMDEALSRLSQT